MVAASSKVSAKKIRANRRNAKKSTGPKTEAGKAKSSQNATSHGIYCRDVVLDGEDQRRFDLLRDTYIHRLRPQDELELSFVDRVAADQWKLIRLQAAEKELYRARQQEHIKRFEKNYEYELEQQANNSADSETLSTLNSLRSALGTPSITLMSFLSEDHSALEHFEKLRQRLQYSISRALRELSLLRQPLKKGQSSLAPSPFSDERFGSESERLAEAFQRLDDEQARLDELLGMENDDQESAESEDVAIETSNTQNEPTAATSPATPAPPEPCEQPAHQNQPQIIDPGAKNALLNTMIDHLHLTELDEPEGS